MVKPIQTEIRSEHFTRATIFVLIANCLQFQKEGQSSPAIVGICRTRALLCELLAMRILREYTTRELIDALSYDFDPLALAYEPEPVKKIGRGRASSPTRPGRAIRTSTLEVAIRAQAKRFLAHPVVVQHLDAIWSGAIVFHNSADGLHRLPHRHSTGKRSNQRHYGALQESSILDNDTSTIKDGIVSGTADGEPLRRSVTLYDPTNASVFKLSRLRVPRYRQTFSMVSYGVMLGLFLAVLVNRSVDITGVEVLFWFWSAGFMLDEIIGFTEQGFGLYIMSVWNAFDLGILLLFLVCYVLRLYGLVLAGDQTEYITGLAYDVLASTAVLLFPRMFSLLDHYRYFSQLLIAFRLMAVDLAATMFLIIVACSGFLVAFTLAFTEKDYQPSHVIYMLFQILMGFSPAAWDVWDKYNVLGRSVMVLFLIIGHFLVVTILITVLTNSFMAIVKNAEEEHQFLFAVNTISMVKSDALFSYVAPTNVLGWLVTPLRYIMPFRQYVRFNRTLIKITHLPILILIFCYERLFLTRYAYNPTQLIERRGRTRHRLPTFVVQAQQNLFGVGVGIREPSVTTQYKERALEEVFRRPYRGSSRKMPSSARRARVVDSWMNGVGNQGGASPPLEQPRSVLEQLETRRPLLSRAKTSQLTGRTRDVSSASRSMWSDPEERRPPARLRLRRVESDELPDTNLEDVLEGEATDADVNGDDELADNDEDERGDRSTLQHDSDKENQPGSRGSTGIAIPPSPLPAYATSPSTRGLPIRRNSKVLLNSMRSMHASPKGSLPKSREQHGHGHARNTSTQTILFKPVSRPASTASSQQSPPPSRRTPARNNSLAWDQSPQLRPVNARKNRPIYDRSGGAYNRSTPNLHRDALAFDLVSDIGDNREPGVDALSGSFGTNFLRTAQPREESTGSGLERLVLARMQTVEQSVSDLLREVRAANGKRGSV